MNIIYEDDYILVCEKPAGLPTQAGKVTDKDMVSELNNYLKGKSIYLIHRLDKPVRGVMVFAKTKEAAADLNRQMTTDAFKKKYYALTERRPVYENATELANDGTYNASESAETPKIYTELTNYMYKDGKKNKSVIVNESEVDSLKKSGVDVKLAKLKYTIMDDLAFCHSYVSSNISLAASPGTVLEPHEFTLLDITLLTGRFHQIRCQFANIGCPIAGDKLYGATSRMKNRKTIGLTAYSLEFNHPFTKEHMKFKIEL